MHATIADGLLVRHQLNVPLLDLGFELSVLSGSGPNAQQHLPATACSALVGSYQAEGEESPMGA